MSDDVATTRRMQEMYAEPIKLSSSPNGWLRSGPPGCRWRGRCHRRMPRVSPRRWSMPERTFFRHPWHDGVGGARGQR
ncbi:inosine-5'-monophosphate dehydrogenase [Cutibacterium acnes JCM 18909]|nr:inosine-5'-monophosphate dehydrogenase [Cutibacterium acnes JCM 18909]